MKKIFVLTAFLLLLAVSSFAAGDETYIDDFAVTGATLYGDEADASATTRTSIGRTSTGVAIAWYCDAGGNGYAIATQHKSGTKAYGTSYDSTAIFQTPGSVDPGNPAWTGGALSATDTTDFTSWNQM
ncbi:hypothetical protein MJO47_09845 [Desulfuromonas sp. KJ2020]|uniref:hypothetical protein n=1 Tax=Desulfuromonas sp. KJ2020 TaxID=2919173 RepID=UPI0020A7A02B|nr:hypothetical protein [Desulfuromonas sp. KJ2020]MCP3177401.1 hypothetical protein [Desulfuromonas sp. KJ2020]